MADSGLGLPEGERDELFQPFGRLDRNRDISGVGLGLFISKRLAEAHGGWLEACDPARGFSTTFALSLPHRATAGMATAATG